MALSTRHRQQLNLQVSNVSWYSTVRFQRVTGIYSKHHLHHKHPPYLHSAWSAVQRRQTIHLVVTGAKSRILIGNETRFHDWVERIASCLAKAHVWYNSVAMVSSWHVNKRSLNYWPFVMRIRSPVDSSRSRSVIRFSLLTRISFCIVDNLRCHRTSVMSL